MRAAPSGTPSCVPADVQRISTPFMAAPMLLMMAQTKSMAVGKLRMAAGKLIKAGRRYSYHDRDKVSLFYASCAPICARATQDKYHRDSGLCIIADAATLQVCHVTLSARDATFCCAT
eukprot:134821-Rhodomonas_salina.1